MSTKDGIFIAGVLVILLFALSEALPQDSDAYSPRRWKERASNAHFGYVVAILVLLCAVNFLDWRSGLETRVGLSAVLTWVIAPIGLLLLIVLSIVEVATYAGDGGHWWRWVGSMALFLAAVFGYFAVAVGPSALLE